MAAHWPGLPTSISLEYLKMSSDGPKNRRKIGKNPGTGGSRENFGVFGRSISRPSKLIFTCSEHKVVARECYSAPVSISSEGLKMSSDVQKNNKKLRSMNLSKIANFYVFQSA